MSKRAWAAIALALVLLVQGTARPGAAEDGPSMRALRVELTTDSDWATLELDGVEVRVQHTVSTSPDDHLWAHDGRWTVVRTSSEAAAVIDIVVELQPDATPRMTLSKGHVGMATATLRTGPDEPPVSEVVLDPTESDRNEIEQPVDLQARTSPLVIDDIDSRPLTLAFYYPWFSMDSVRDRRIRPDKPVPPYATDDPAHVRSMVDQASEVGIDGFLVSWEGQHARSGALAMLRAAAENQGDFELAPLLELDTFRSGLLGRQVDVGAANGALRSFFDGAGQASLLHVDSRPVVVVFGMWALDAADWREFRQRIADLDPFVIGDRVDPELPVDGYYLYDPNPHSAATLDSIYDDAVDRTRLQSVVEPGVPQVLWSATVSPGYDTGQLLPLGRKRDREQGSRYDDTWRVALRSAPEWVFVTSWNEWYEQTHISPGTITGRTALDQTARWNEQFAVAG